MNRHCLTEEDHRDEGAGVMVGEWGACRHTPHDVTLIWMKSSLELFYEAGFGWVLWEFRGAFGVIDSQREDVDYERLPSGKQTGRCWISFTASEPHPFRNG